MRVRGGNTNKMLRHLTEPGCGVLVSVVTGLNDLTPGLNTPSVARPAPPCLSSSTEPSSGFFGTRLYHLSVARCYQGTNECHKHFHTTTSMIKSGSLLLPSLLKTLRSGILTEFRFSCFRLLIFLFFSLLKTTLLGMSPCSERGVTMMALKSWTREKTGGSVVADPD